MADSKVTDLALATTPLSGTEVVYLVQGGIDTQATAQDIANLGGGGSVTWGGITGTLSSQADLQAALDGKQPLSTVLTNTTASFTTAQETKLAGIEAGADVTDAANVAAAGAVMESDYTPAHSLLVQQSGTGSPTTLQVANNTILGRLSGGGSDIDALTPAEVRTLINVADGATANQTDAFLLNRANHTGTQAISTVTGLQTALDEKAPLASPAFTGTVTGITAAMVGLGNVNNTSDASKPVSTAQAAADAAVQAFSIQRSNHTGTQLASTISDFAATTRGTVITGYTSGAGTVAATDTILQAIQKLNGNDGLKANIAGQVFTGAISATNLSGTNTGDQTTITGNAGTATALQTGRTISITGDLSYTSPSFNGSANVTAAGTLATVNSNVGSFGLAGSVAQFTVNAKGLITAAANVAISIAATAISDATAAGRSMLTAATAAAQTALLDVFTSSAKGLAPASGGGTVNFLRADGTWAAPSGGGGGSGDVVGPASSTDEAIARFDGTTGKLLQDSSVRITDNGSIILPENSNPTPSSAGEMKLFSRQIANRLMPAFVGPSGLDSALQPLLARNKVGYWCPPGNATTAPGVLGFTAPTVTGFTATARNVATTSLFTRMRRLGYVTAATAGTVGQWRIAVAQFTVGGVSGLGGFTYIVRFGISDAASVSGARMFMGMRNVVTPTNVEPSTLTQCIGIGHGASDTNMFLYYGGSAAQTPINLGANFPANTLSVDVYELALFSSPTSGDVHYEVTRINTGHVATGTITNSGATVLPTNTTLIGPWGYRTNNATALAVGLDVMSAYIETDV